MTTQTKQLSFRATVLLEGGEWVAHCLDLDIVTTGPTPETAMDELAGAVGTQLWYAREHENFEHLFRPAPAGAWLKLGEILAGPHKTLVRPIDDSDCGADRDVVNLEAQLTAA